jgi:hypothetical protein
MALLSTQSDTAQRTIRGREKRNITLNTKLTETEFAEVVKFCEARQIAFGEWVRELVLRELSEATGERRKAAHTGRLRVDADGDSESQKTARAQNTATVGEPIDGDAMGQERVDHLAAA